MHIQILKIYLFYINKNYVNINNQFHTFNEQYFFLLDP